MQLLRLMNLCYFLNNSSFISELDVDESLLKIVNPFVNTANIKAIKNKQANIKSINSFFVLKKLFINKTYYNSLYK